MSAQKTKAVKQPEVEISAVTGLPKRVRRDTTKEREEAAKAAVMTAEEWYEWQTDEMAKKWPKPEYMAEKKEVVYVRDGGEGAYRDKTYERVTRWRADTVISYRPHAKKPGSKSHVRYEAYSKATTVGQALELGSYPQDWCYDFEHGFIRVHGPVADDAIDPSKVDASANMTEVEKILAQWYKRELAKKYNLDIRALTTVSGETTIMRAHRLVADRKAEQFLKDAAANNRAISDEDVATALSTWAFARNVGRQNVLPENQEWVWSDTLGLLRDRVGDIHLTTPTKRYSNFVKLITQWLCDRIPEEVNTFKFTSLNLNCNYAAKRHRDGNNFGPSFIKGFGTYTGGKLAVFPEDDRGRSDLSKLPMSDRMSVDISVNLAMFNGNSAHEVDDFKGNRFSVVYFTAGCHAKASEENKDDLRRLGFPYPADNEDPHALLPVPNGYDNKPAAKKATSKSAVPKVRVWNANELAERTTRGTWAPAVMDEIRKAKEKAPESSDAMSGCGRGRGKSKTNAAESPEKKETAEGGSSKKTPEKKDAGDKSAEDAESSKKVPKRKRIEVDAKSKSQAISEETEKETKKTPEKKENAGEKSAEEAEQSSKKAPKRKRIEVDAESKSQVTSTSEETEKENQPTKNSDMKNSLKSESSLDASSAAHRFLFGSSVATASKEANRPMKQLKLAFK